MTGKRRVHLIDHVEPREDDLGETVWLACGRLFFTERDVDRYEATEDPARITCLLCERSLDVPDVHRAAWQMTYSRALNELRERHRFEFDLIRLDLYPAAAEEAADFQRRLEEYRDEQ